MLQRFRRKFENIEAVQFDGTEASAKRIAWLFSPTYIHHDRMGANELIVCIHTTEGVRVVLPGAWVVRGIEGMVFSLGDDLFNELYEQDV